MTSREYFVSEYSDRFRKVFEVLLFCKQVQCSGSSGSSWQQRLQDLGAERAMLTSGAGIS